MTSVFKSENYFNWGGSIIKGEDNKYHLFYSRWKKEYGFLGWLTHSEIAHAVAEFSWGPYEYKETVLKNRGKQWDAITAHNPKIKFFDGKYYLYYISTHINGEKWSEEKMAKIPFKGYSSKEWGILRNNQRTGVAVAKSLNGKWKRSKKPIIEPGEGTPIRKITVNPGVTQGKDGKYYMVIKGDKPKSSQRIQVMIQSEHPDKDWEYTGKYMISNIDTEDASLWYDSKLEKFYAVFHTNHGGKYIGLMESKNGLDWKKSTNYKLTPKKLKTPNGEMMRFQRMERPYIFLENGIPQTILFAVKINKNTSATVFKKLTHEK